MLLVGHSKVMKGYIKWSLSHFRLHLASARLQPGMPVLLVQTRQKRGGSSRPHFSRQFFSLRNPLSSVVLRQSVPRLHGRCYPRSQAFVGKRSGKERGYVGVCAG